MSAHHQAAVFLALTLGGCFSFTSPTEPDLCESHVDLNKCATDGGSDADADAQTASQPDSGAGEN
jgi:hypothetical protein